VTLAAKRIDGVKDCKASYKTGTAEVTYDPAKTTPQAIAKVISEKTGFKATAPKKPSS
jgi:copper chaperone CopZ